MALFPFEYWSVCHLALCVYCFAAGHLRTCFTLHGCHWAFSWLLVVLLVVVCWHSIAAVCATGRKHDSIRHWTARDCLPFNFHFVILIFLKLCFIIQIGPFMLNKKNEILLLYDWFLIYTTLEIILLLFAAEWSDNNINLWGECWADSNVVWSSIPDESG